MLRRSLACLAVAVFLPALAACGDDSSGGSTATSTGDSSATSDSTADSTGGTGATDDSTGSEATTTSVNIRATTTLAPTTTTPPTTAAPATTVASGPKVTSFAASTPAACAAPEATFQPPPPTVTLTWQATGADSVYVAIDNADGPFESNLPLSGSYELPFACPGPHTYYVVAVKGGQKDVKSKTFP